MDFPMSLLLRYDIISNSYYKFFKHFIEFKIITPGVLIRKFMMMIEWLIPFGKNESIIPSHGMTSP